MKGEEIVMHILHKRDGGKAHDCALCPIEDACDKKHCSWGGCRCNEQKHCGCLNREESLRLVKKMKETENRKPNKKEKQMVKDIEKVK